MKISNRWKFQDRALQDFVTTIVTLLNGNLDGDNIPVLEGISGATPAVKCKAKTFNATIHWGTASGGYYTITFTHNLESTSVVPFVFDTTTGQISVQPDRVSVDNLNVVSIRTLEDPDLRFAGTIVVLG